VNIEERRFGFELEVGSGRLRNLNNRLARAGLKWNDDDESYTHDYHCECDWCRTNFCWDRQDWWMHEDHRYYPVKVQYDSSCGAEVITAPIAWGDPRWRDMTFTLDDVLNRAPAIDTNDRCSFHVHVEASDLTRGELANLARLMYSNEAVLFRLASQGPRHRGQYNNYRYCMPFSAFESENEARYGLSYALDEDPQSTTIGETKYVSLNFRPLSRQNTVEFRLWDVVRTAWQMQFLVDLSVAMVQRAKKKPVSKSKGGTLGRYTRTKSEAKGRTAAAHFLNKVQSVLPERNRQGFVQRFWQTFDGKQWQPSWAELTRLHGEDEEAYVRLENVARGNRPSLRRNGWNVVASDEYDEYIDRDPYEADDPPETMPEPPPCDCDICREEMRRRNSERLAQVRAEMQAQINPYATLANAPLTITDA
jgi:hypothetical protein